MTAIPWLTLYRNTISEWAVGFKYGNFTLKLTCGKKSLASRGPKALRKQAFLHVGKFLEVKKFPYLKLGPFGNPVFFKKKREILLHF
jgi:hypothetical protein